MKRARARTRFKPVHLKLSSAASAGLPLNRASLHHQLVARLREMIQYGELKPGAPLPENSLCGTFGVSRTPLREALKVLASEHLVELRPFRTPRVATIDADDVAAVFEVLVALEQLAAERVCRLISEIELAALEALHEELVRKHAEGHPPSYFLVNQRIHAEIVRLARNPVLQNLWQSLAPKVFRARILMSYDAVRWRESLAEHEALMAALRKRDHTAFVRALAEHNRSAGNAVVAHAHQLAASDPEASNTITPREESSTGG
jgi:DNA-binding GntR family transcriptional regulator